jgi:membrane-associated phospholipid phosphatase
MDLAIAHFLNQLGHGVIDPFTDAICAVPLLVALWVLLLILVVRLDAQNGRRVAATVALAVVIHFVVSEALLKHLVLAELPMRVRPYLAHPDQIQPVGHRFTDSSFPSSHAASTAAIVTVFGHAYRRFAAAGAAFALGDLRCTPGCGDRCLLADASEDALRVFALHGGALEEGSPVTVDPAVGLPPRGLGGL